LTILESKGLEWGTMQSLYSVFSTI
jgi:hypothetical protein